MYLDNPKQLFEDLKAIPTMYDYMISCYEDGQDEDLENLISIVECYHDQLHDGDENGGCRWDLSECETEQDRQQMLKDYRTINAIWKEIKREIKSNYVMVCGNCGTVYFYQRKPKYSNTSDTSDGGENYTCGECRKENTINIYTFDSWLYDKGIHDIVDKYLKNPYYMIK